MLSCRTSSDSNKSIKIEHASWLIALGRYGVPNFERFRWQPFFCFVLSSSALRQVRLRYFYSFNAFTGIINTTFHESLLPTVHFNTIICRDTYLRKGECVAWNVGFLNQVTDGLSAWYVFFGSWEWQICDAELSRLFEKKKKKCMFLDPTFSV